MKLAGLAIRGGVAVMAAFAVTVSAYGAASSSNAAAAGSTSSAKGPIVIGVVIDQSKYMKSFDEPPLRAAEIEAKRINASGGVNGRKIEFKVYDDQLDASFARSDALRAIDAGAKILWVGCDVDLATPAIQVGLSHHLLTVAPCIGTNQMGPARFGSAGKLAFTFGNAAQNDGAALARLLIKHNWKTATVVTDKSLAYFIKVSQYFTDAYEKLGGKIISQLSYTAGDHTVTQIADRAADSKADVTILTTTDNPDLPTFVTAERTAGNSKPIVGPWSIAGGFWEPKDPKISNNIWFITYASVFGDPNPQVESLLKELSDQGKRPLTGGFVTGPTALVAIVNAIKKTGGSLDGSKLAEVIESYKGFDTISGKVSFSPRFHAVIGRSYRVMEVSDGHHPKYVGMQSPGPISFVASLK